MARLQPPDVMDEKIVVQSIRMIEIGGLPKIKGQIFKVSVIRVLLDKDHVLGIHGFENAFRNSGFSGPGPTRDSYYHKAVARG
jgi:hypothetical protein